WKRRYPVQQLVILNSASLFLKHGNLFDLRTRTPAATRTTNHTQHGECLQCRAWNKNSLRVGARVWWNDEKALGRDLGQIIWHHAFQDLVVLKVDAYPESLGTRPGREGLTDEAFRVGKIAHKVHTLDVFEVHVNNFSGCVQKFQLTLNDKSGRGNVAAHRIAVHLANDYFLVCGGHG